MKEAKIISDVTELPLSCKSAMERLEREMEKEESEAEDNYRYASLSGKGIQKLTEYEQKMKEQGYGDISLVAYEKESQH